MTIEKELGRIADALESFAAFAERVVNVAVAQGQTEEPAKAEPKKATKATKLTKVEEPETKPVEDDFLGEKEEAPTKEAVKATLTKYMEAEGKDAAISLLKKHGGGASNLSELKAEHYASVVKAAGAA